MGQHIVVWQSACRLPIFLLVTRKQKYSVPVTRRIVSVFLLRCLAGLESEKTFGRPKCSIDRNCFDEILKQIMTTVKHCYFVIESTVAILTRQFLPTTKKDVISTAISFTNLCTT